MFWSTLAQWAFVNQVKTSPSINFPPSAISSPGLGQVLLGTPPCDALVAAGLRNRLILPNETAYEAQLQTWWAANTRVHPWCLVLPYNTKEVSLVLTTLLSAGQGAGDWHIAIKSGGHASTSGSNNIVNGVTIDLSMMNGSYYDQVTNTAWLEPGGRWGNVYASLQEKGVTVAGARDGDVGVGGFLLGGGLSYFYPKLGFACDSIVNYEVVLVNGTVVNANKTSHSDLWRALKGGGGNFGIVTRFDLEAMPTRDLVYELRYLAAGVGGSDKFVTGALVEYADHSQSEGDDALVTFWAHDTSMAKNTNIIGAIHVNTAGDSKPTTAFNEIRSLPAIFNITAVQTMAVGTAAPDSMLKSGARRTISTLFFKNDPAIIDYAIAEFNHYITSLKKIMPPQNFTSTMYLQPIPSYLGNSGNMLGLEGIKHNAILWAGIAGIDAELPNSDLLTSIAQAELNAMSSRINKFAKSVNGDMELIYLNYADASQNPLGSYGSEQVKFLREVAEKYDPEGAFQKRVSGGFKISRVSPQQ